MYVRFPLSLRNVENLLFERGIERHYRWRAVDHEGESLESYVTKTKDKGAALTFMKKVLQRHGLPELGGTARGSGDAQHNWKAVEVG